jgi:expansin (peptidoglycan-binding protein)
LDYPLLHGDVRVACLIGADIDVSVCGQCLLVSGITGNVYVRVIHYDDSDEKTSDSQLELPRSIVTLIGGVLEGLLFDTTWKFVPCPASLLSFNGNLVYRLLEGTTDLKVKLQILNSVQGIVDVQYKSSNMDIWATATLLADNCFKFNDIPSEGLIGAIKVKVEAQNGEILFHNC